MFAEADASLADYPRLAGETDDSPRFARAISENPSGVVYVPRGVYSMAAPIIVTNLCSLLLHKSAVLRAVAEMDFILELDGTAQRTAVTPEDYNLFFRGGQLDGNGLASCLAVCAFAHFTLADTTLLNGRKAGLSVDANGKYGYEMFVSNLYCKTVQSGLAGNIALDIHGGDGHYTDVVVVDYTVGFRMTDHAWSNRLTRCHVWGGPVPPPREGELPEMLKDSICFDIHVANNSLRDCYADTGAIGYLIDASTRLFGCNYYSNPVFKLDGIVCIRQTSGLLEAYDCLFSKMAEHEVVYEGVGGDVIWSRCQGINFSREELPFEPLL